MRRTANYYWLKAALISVAAFGLGVAIYVVVGIIMAQNTAGANAFHQQVTIQPIECECIIKFFPEQPLPRFGTIGDPYVTYNAHVPLVVGVAGAGVVTIEDQNGNILFTYNKTTTAYEEFVAPIDLPDGLGIYELVVKLDGLETVGPNVELPMYIDYRALPLPQVPNTGAGGSYVYLGGYAVQTWGVLWAGLVFGSGAFGIFVLAAKKRQRQEAVRTRSNLAVGRGMSQKISPRALEQSGVIAGKRRGRKGR